MQEIGTLPARPAPLTSADLIDREDLAHRALALLDLLDWMTEEERLERITEIRAELHQTGSYTHTYDELLHGSQIAWRNHARCIGRLHWRSLRVVDRRDVQTAEEVAEACIDHLRMATNDGNIRSTITIFPPERPDGGQIRIWNPQLIRYAGYRQADGSVIGDPAHTELTEIVEAMGWRGSAGRFDLLPLVIQMPGEAPRMFDLPPDVVLEVPITHPELPWFADLGLKWHALPAISDMSMELGGLSYTACPFNGWYVSFEIGARNFSDEKRYNLLPVVAERLGLDTGRTNNLWKDRALIELNQAVIHSFRVANVRLVDHHVAARQFVTHEEREERAGRTTPADWAWVVPPISGSTTPTFHRPYSTEPELSPNFHYQPPAWRSDASRPGAVCPFPHDL
ncbi:nitric oxide synthase oxygenase [Actinomadura scrupuli]|uniref:nitric oxide synthase oxygenase n=1 Tax=Actinomadura scrupuli TaxID=559629 RepID=UPI003D9975B4